MLDLNAFFIERNIYKDEQNQLNQMNNFFLMQALT